MPRYCAIVLFRAGQRGGKKSAGRIKQAATPCVKDVRSIAAWRQRAREKKQAPSRRLFYCRRRAAGA
jgi:hypothetical protein